MTELAGGMANAPEAVMLIQPTEGVPADVGAAPSMQEMPASHADVDVSTLTVEGLIKACPHYAGLAAANPELARTKATEDLGRAREEAKRQEDMTKEEKEDDFWSSMSDLVEKKPETKEKGAPEESAREHKAEPAHESATKRHAERDVLKPQPVVKAERLASQVADTRTDRVSAAVQIEAQRPPAEIAPVVVRHVETLAQNVVTPSPEQLAEVMARSAAAELDQQVASELGITSSNIITATSESDTIADAETDSLEDVESINQITIQEQSIRPNTDSAAVTSEFDLSGVEQAPPTVTFERFNQALGRLVNEKSPQTSDESTEFSDEHPALEPPVAAVVTEVADRLANLDIEQKGAALLIVPNIVESVQTIKQLQDEAAAPSKIVAAVETMREQIIQLFEAINLGYDGEKIEYFIQAMLTPGFAVRTQIFLTPEELAKMGTREVKLTSHFTALFSQVATPDDTPSYRIGQAVLFFV